MASLRTATERGIDRFMALENDPGFAAIRDTPAFRELIRDVAGRFLERAGQRGTATQPTLRIMAHAHMARGELDEAAALFEQALRAGGPMDAIVRAELLRVNADRSRTARDGPDREGARDLPQNP